MTIENKEKIVGLLGGSFNPAHDGHVHISREAVKYLNLDEVWWLVSPQNPLKDSDGMADFNKRMKSAKAITENDSYITVTDIEVQMGTQYTVDSILELERLFPDVKFIWLMGADNLVSFHQWQGWNEIAKQVHIAVLDRPKMAEAALNSEAAIALKQHQKTPKQAEHLIDEKLPAWCFLPIELCDISSTEIREKGELEW